MKILFLPSKKIEEIAGYYEQDPADGADRNLLRQRISAALRQLRDPRYRDVLFLYYGLDGSYEHTYVQIARILKTSRERVRAMHCCTLRWLGQPKYQLRSLWLDAPEALARAKKAVAYASGASDALALAANYMNES